MKALVVLAVLATSIAVPSAPSAPAGPPGNWPRITDKADRNIDEVGLARGSDGVLHVLWRRQKAIWDTPVSNTGKAGAAKLVLGGFDVADNPDVVAAPAGGLQAFFIGR